MDAELCVNHYLKLKLKHMKKIYFGILCLFFSLTLQATVHVVNVVDNEFNPATLNVLVGDTVRWARNNSLNPHTTTSTTIPAGATAWNRAINSTTPTFDYRVTVAGTYNYHCNIHPGITGSFTATGGASINEYVSDSDFTVNGNLVRDAIRITINLKRAYPIRLQLYDMKGTLVKELNNNDYAPGIYTEIYPVSDMAKGFYLLRLETANSRVAKKIIIE